MKLNKINFEIIEYTKRILLYLDRAYFDVYDALHIKNYPFDIIIQTHAGLTAEAIEYLLAMTKISTVFDNYFLSNNIRFQDFDPAYVYTIFFQCMNKSEYTIDEKITASILEKNNHRCDKTAVGHELVLINNNGDWYMWYSYNGIKKFSERKIELDILQEFIYEIRQSFSINKWNRIFDVTEIGTNAKSAYCVINKYSAENDVVARFHEIVNLAKDRLANDGIGITLPYIYLLDNNLDIVAAREYLDYIAKVITKN